MRVKEGIGLLLLLPLIVPLFAFEPRLIFTFDSINAQYGQPIALLNDINNDQINDFAISGYGLNKIHFFYGGNSLDTIPDRIDSLWPSLYRFGHRIVGCGDVDNNGYDDFAVVLIKYYPYYEYYTFVCLGEESPGEYQYRKLDLRNTKHLGIGDLNADSYNDIVVASYHWFALYYGGPDFDTTYDFQARAPNENEMFGYALGAGDINGDGAEDLAVGAPYGNKVYLYLGPVVDSIPDWTLVAGSEFSFGRALLLGKDINGDGSSDLIIGAPYWNEQYEAQGRVFIFYGGEDFDTIPDIILSGTEGWQYFGSSLAGGDLNGDGIEDLVVGVVGFSNPYPNMGAVYIYYGGNPFDTIPDLIFYGRNPYDRFGTTVSFLGDVTENGYPDILIGAPWHDGSHEDCGVTYLYDMEDIRVEEKVKRLPGAFPQVRPVPFQEELHILSGSLKLNEIKLYDLMGRRIRNWKIIRQDPGDLVLDTRALNSGIYFIEVQTTRGKFLYKVVRVE